jgi:hypothetical protein
MRNKITIYESENINNHNISTLINLHAPSASSKINSSVLKILTSEDREEIIKYLEDLGLSKDPNLVFLSSIHHYYYDAEEMKNVETIINLKEFNQIKQIKSFLNSIFYILPEKSNFIGCFVDNEKNSVFSSRDNLSKNNTKNSKNAIENGIVSRIPFLNMVYNIMDSKTNRYLSKISVSLLLEDHGFKIMNMTDINGLTYFLAQKKRTSDN